MSSQNHSNKNSSSKCIDYRSSTVLFSWDLVKMKSSNSLKSSRKSHYLFTLNHFKVKWFTCLPKLSTIKEILVQKCILLIRERFAWRWRNRNTGRKSWAIQKRIKDSILEKWLCFPIRSELKLLWFIKIIIAFYKPWQKHLLTS